MIQNVVYDFSFDIVFQQLNQVYTEYSRAIQMSRYYLCNWCIAESRLMQIEKILDEEERGH